MIRRANNTCRDKGAVGHKAIVPRLVPEVATKKDTILDFGAGRNAIHMLALLSQGFNVEAWEFGGNFNPAVHNPKALNKKYNLVYASNVLNVQSDIEMLRETIKQMRGCVLKTGRVLCNYPYSPRLGGFSPKEITTELSKFFEVERYPYKGSIIWLLQPK